MEKSRTDTAIAARMGALSAARAFWQSCLCVGFVLILPNGAMAQDEGPLLTIRRGDFICELPGTALTSAGIRQPAEDFSIRHGSTYVTATGRGSYMASGDQIRMTSGPKAGQRYRRVSDATLRKLSADGRDSDLRCIRTVLNNR
jgi:hypothetical protein